MKITRDVQVACEDTGNGDGLCFYPRWLCPHGQLMLIKKLPVPHRQRGWFVFALLAVSSQPANANKKGVS